MRSGKFGDFWACDRYPECKYTEQPSKKPEKVQPQAPKREFHLSPEQVRTNALNAAIEVWKSENSINIKKIASDFEEYLWNGN